MSVAWDGALHACDFNHLLDLPLGGKPRAVWEDSNLADLAALWEATADHRFGRTAGSGSSCGGSLAEGP